MFEWTVFLVVLTVILLRTTARGGDWSDVMIGEARYNNWWNNFEFTLMFVCLGLVIVGVIGYVAVMAAKETPEEAIGKTSSYTSRRPKKVFIQDLDPKTKLHSKSHR